MKKSDQIKALLKDIKILDTPAERAIYSHDIGDIPPILTRLLFKIMPDIVVQPKNVAEIVKVIKAANETSTPVTVRGAASWGFGGVIPAKGGIVIDLSPFRKVLAVNVKQKTATVEAGARWSDLDIIAKKSGLCIMTYPSSKFSTIGGWLSTGGYAINSFKYGHVSQAVVAITVVTGAGEVKKLTPKDLEFNNFISTEGQMGIIVEVTLKLRDVPEGSYPCLLYVASDKAGFDFIEHYLKSPIVEKHKPNTIRFLDNVHMADINELMRAEIFEKRAAILAEFSSAVDLEKFEEFALKDIGTTEAPQFTANYLWNERLFGMKSKRLGPTILASEVIIPLKSAVAFIKRAKQLAGYFGAQVFIDTYVLATGEALLNANFLCDSRKKKYYIAVPLVAILTKAAISLGAEPYGVGLWNAGYVNKHYTPQRLQALKKYKAQADPNNILNRGKALSRGGKGLSGILFNPSVFNFLIQLLVVTAPVLGRIIILLLGKNKKVNTLDAKLSTYACAQCGNCLAVCPAYIVTNDEKVSPKGKISLTRKLLDGKSITKAEAAAAFLCMHCKSCEEICQTNLELISLWETLEEKLAVKFGKPTQQIADFLEKVDASQEYWDMVDRNS